MSPVASPNYSREIASGCDFRVSAKIHVCEVDSVDCSNNLKYWYFFL
jgi:hypothetical protein